MQMLYLSESTTDALIKHINSLLRFYAYDDSRIHAGSRIGKATRHQIRDTNKGEIISTNLPPEKKGHFKVTEDRFKVTEDRFTVYGVNPYVMFRCSNSTNSCWLLHPIHQREWMQIVKNEDAASELSKALGHLIKTLQKNS